MRELRLTEFAGAEGTAYRVAAGEGSYELVLEEAAELPSSSRDGGSFRLLFRGPFEPILAQAIYPFEAGDFASEIFIVPVGRDDSGTEYEAIFN
jgi:hypothetical protein